METMLMYVQSRCTGCVPCYDKIFQIGFVYFYFLYFVSIAMSHKSELGDDDVVK